VALEAGQKLLHYRLLEKIGEGGMGVVWKALDTDLDREVAIKVLPEAFAEDGERLARLEQEARLLASLNHPNIAAIYGLHTRPEDGLRFLAMEFVQGENLERRLARGALDPQRAIAIALQIAAALEVAHENGIVHRDLKPANICFGTDRGMSRTGGFEDGSVRVLDFGLAKALDGGPEKRRDLTQSPTLTGMGTEAGVILGTASYMSPEQARGQGCDRRGDIWSFGVVLYEMLTGERLFDGETLSDTLADILRHEVDFDALPAGTPLQVRRLLSRCLNKDVSQRLQAIGDARIELQEALTSPEYRVAGSDLGERRSDRRFRGRLIAGLGALSIVATLAALWGWLRPAETARGPKQFTIPLPPGEELQAAPSISRDGTQLAYVSRRGVEPSRLYVRPLDAFDAQAVPGTDNANMPFFSPDGRAVGFFADGFLKTVELSGGSPRVLAPAPSPFGGTWTEDDYIIFTKTINSGLLRIPADGGPVQTLTTPDLGAKGYAHVWPRALRGGTRVAFTVWSGSDASGGTALFDLETDSWSFLMKDSGGGMIIDSGYLLTPWNLEVEHDLAAVRAAPLSLDGTSTLAETATVLEGVYSVPWRDEAWMSVSANGTLAYVPGTVADRQLVWVLPDGSMEPAVEIRAVHDNLALSLDDSRAVVKNGGHLWVYDLEGGTRLRLTSEEFNGGPVWDPAGNRVFFSSNRAGDWDIYARSADGTGDTERLWDRQLTQWVNSISPDGTLMIAEPNPETGIDLWVRTADGETKAFLVTPSNEDHGAFDPTGTLVAYASNETGREEIYIVPYPGPGQRVPVSREGGTIPRWSRDGSTLFYLQGDTVMAATLDRSGDIEVVDRRRQFSGKFFTRYTWVWDVTADDRFLMIHRDPGSVPDRINIVLDWTSEVERMALR
jgi:serine/threonine-protein kinase